MGNGRNIIGPGGGSIPALGEMPISHKELQDRQKMEMDLQMVLTLQKGLVAAGDLVNVTSAMKQYEAFAELPGREARHKQALSMVADLEDMQLRYLVSFRKKLKELELLRDDKSLKLTDLGGIK